MNGRVGRKSIPEREILGKRESPGVGHLDVVNSAGPRLWEEEASTEPRDTLESRRLVPGASVYPLVSPQLPAWSSRTGGEEEKAPVPRDFLYSKRRGTQDPPPAGTQ